MTIYCIVFFGTGLLEYLQTLTAVQHGTISDVCEKIAVGFWVLSPHTRGGVTTRSGRRINATECILALDLHEPQTIEACCTKLRRAYGHVIPF
jgi:hypothetical protein